MTDDLLEGAFEAAAAKLVGLGAVGELGELGGDGGDGIGFRPWQSRPVSQRAV